MPSELCRHVRYNGIRCGSPAMRENNFCYYHHTFHTKHEPINPAITPAMLERDGLTETAMRHPLIALDQGYRSRMPIMLNLPTLEDRDSVLLAISMVVTALGEYRIEAKLANSILFGLQLALANLSRYQPTDGTCVTETTLGPDGLPIAA